MSRYLICAAVLFCVSAAHLRGHGGLHEAIEAVSAVIARSPGDAALFLRRAELRRLHQDWQAAEADYAHALALQPELHGVKYGLPRRWQQPGNRLARRGLQRRWLGVRSRSTRLR